MFRRQLSIWIKGSAVRYELDMRIPSLNLKNSKSYCLNTILIKRNIPEIPNVIMLFILFVLTKHLQHLSLYFIKIKHSYESTNRKSQKKIQLPSSQHFLF